jgi:hypothetical protein
MDDIFSRVLWTKLVMEAQGCKIFENVVFRDNTSAMKLESSNKKRSGERTRHLEIKYVYVTDLIQSQNDFTPKIT